MPSLPSLTDGAWTASPWLMAPAALILWVAVFLAVKTIVLGAMRGVARRTAWAWDDILIAALWVPLLIAIVSSGLVVFNRTLPLPPEWDRAFDILFDFSIVLALVMFVDRATRGVLDRFAAGSTVMQGARGLIQAGVRGVAIGIGILIFLDSIGISITPILASLGVGSLALAVARGVQRTVTGAVAEAEPVLRFLGFGDSSIQLSVTLRARDFTGMAEVRHEFVKRVQSRLRQEGIIIPYPVRTLDFPPAHLEGLKDILGGGRRD